MKKFKVNSEKCICCGMCISQTDLIAENDVGKAYAIESGYIADDFLKKAEEILLTCPQKAIAIVEDRYSGLNLSEIVEQFKKELLAITISDIKMEDIKFEPQNYSVSMPYPSGEYDYRYSSESKAEKAGLEEFDRIAYSQYRKFILEIMVQYKYDKLKYYYDFNGKSFWEINNKKYEDVLMKFMSLAQASSKKKLKFPANFTSFEVYPDRTPREALKNCLYILANFEEFRIIDSVWAEFKTGSYSNRSDYASYMDTDDTEEYLGTSFFGGDKYEYRYCYRNVRGAVEEFIRDLKNAMKYVDLEESPYHAINYGVKQYRANAEKMISEKLETFKRLVFDAYK